MLVVVVVVVVVVVLLLLLLLVPSSPWDSTPSSPGGNSWCFSGRNSEKTAAAGIETLAMLAAQEVRTDPHSLPRANKPTNN